jgi:hypothetical protein
LNTAGPFQKRSSIIFTTDTKIRKPCFKDCQASVFSIDVYTLIEMGLQKISKLAKKTFTPTFVKIHY